MFAHALQLLPLIVVVLLVTVAFCQKPHVVLVVADDLGWNDIGLNNPLFQTPTLDRLARSGIILDNHYSQASCSPSRASLLTGRYPSHIGAGLTVGNFGILQDNGLPMGEVLLPEKLKHLGYYTALVGKWHLGMSRRKYFPTRRGFDYFYGFYGGHIDYWDYGYNGDAKCPKDMATKDIIDLRQNEEVVENLQGTYSTELFSSEAVRLISSHNASQPLFLMMAFPNNHHPLQAPEKYVNRFVNTISDTTRRVLAAKSLAMDEAVHNISQALEHRNMWNDTVFVFLSDNGGIPAHGGSNWPLRGVKGTLYEGGIRTVCFLHYQRLKKSGFKSRLLAHISDWYPTLLSLAGGKRFQHEPKLDGFDIWRSLTINESSPRKEVLLNVGNSKGIRVGAWKLLFREYNVSWFRPPETMDHSTQVSTEPTWPEKKNGRILVSLFNIEKDPEERFDRRCSNPKMVRTLLTRLKGYAKTIREFTVVERCNPPALAYARKFKAWGPWAQYKPKAPLQHFSFSSRFMQARIDRLYNVRDAFKDCKKAAKDPDEIFSGIGEDDECDRKVVCGIKRRMNELS